MEMRFDILGPLRASTPDGPVDMPGGRARALLAWLVLNANEPVSVDATVPAVYPFVAPSTAAAQVRLIARQLSDLLGASLLPDDGRLLLRCPPEAVDAVRFERGIADTTRLIQAGRRDQARARLQVSLDLWRAEPYPELERALPAVAEIERLRETYLRGLEARYGLELTAPVDYRLVADLRSAVTLHSERPRLARQLALALYRTGQQVEALRMLRAVASRDAQADALQAAMLRQDPALHDGELAEHTAVIHHLPRGL